MNRHEPIGWQSNEAVAAVRSVSAGKSKNEVRELLAAELHTRGITPPAEPILSHVADRVLADHDALTRLRLAGRGLGILADLGTKATRDIKEQFHRVHLGCHPYRPVGPAGRHATASDRQADETQGHGLDATALISVHYRQPTTWSQQQQQQLAAVTEAAGHLLPA